MQAKILDSLRLSNIFDAGLKRLHAAR